MTLSGDGSSSESKPKGPAPHLGGGGTRRGSFGQRGIRCPLLRPDPAQRGRLAEVCNNLVSRIAEAHREGWLGEVEGLRISLAAARGKLTQLDEHTSAPAAVQLGMPSTNRAPATRPPATTAAAEYPTS